MGELFLRGIKMSITHAKYRMRNCMRGERRALWALMSPQMHSVELEVQNTVDRLAVNRLVLKTDILGIGRVEVVGCTLNQIAFKLARLFLSDMCYKIKECQTQAEHLTLIKGLLHAGNIEGAAASLILDSNGDYVDNMMDYAKFLDSFKIGMKNGPKPEASPIAPINVNMSARGGVIVASPFCVPRGTQGEVAKS